MSSDSAGGDGSVSVPKPAHFSNDDESGDAIDLTDALYEHDLAGVSFGPTGPTLRPHASTGRRAEVRAEITRGEHGA